MFSPQFLHYSFVKVLYNMFLKKLHFNIDSLRWQPCITNRETDLMFRNRKTFHLICSCE